MSGRASFIFGGEYLQMNLEYTGKILAVVGISVLLFFALSFNNNPSNVLANNLVTPHKEYSESYIPHDPIYIAKVSDFEKLGFEGNGTESNPYLIENLSIYVRFDGIGISIVSTSVFFIIQNCEFYSFDSKSGTGIRLEKVVNGVVYGCDFNTLSLGVSIIKSEKCVIDSNTFSGLGKGIYVTQSLWLNLRGNNLTNSGYGVHLSKIDFSTLLGNNLDKCNYGILIESGVEIQVLSNEIAGSFFGLYLHNSVRSQSKSNIIHHSQYGVYYAYSQYCNITSAELTQNKYGISLLEIDGGTFSTNLIELNSDYGFHVKNSRDINILSNTIFDNKGIGLYLNGVAGAAIHQNEIGYTSGINAVDFVGSATRGLVNNWDTNSWSDYKGTSNYSISGDRGSLDFDPYYIIYVNSPLDIIVEAPASGFINWSASALKPSHYEIKQDGAVVEEGVWDGEDLSISFQNLDIGTYVFDVLVTAESGRSASDVVSVYTSDTTPPEWVQTPKDQIIECGNTLSLQYIASDYYGVSGWWVNSSDFSIENGLLQSYTVLDYGNYTLEIRAYDPSDNYALHILQISVKDTILPSIDSPDDISILEGEIGNAISWTVYDCNPASYEIVIDGVSVESGEWTSDMTSIRYSLDTLDVGIYTFTIILVDIAGNSVTDDVQVTVEAPTTTTETSTTTTGTPSTSPTTTISEPSTSPDSGLNGSNVLTLSLIGIGSGLAIIVVLLYIRKR